VVQLEKEGGTAEEHSLDKEARKWASRVAREYKSIIHTQRVRDRETERERHTHIEREIHRERERDRERLIEREEQRER